MNGFYDIMTAWMSCQINKDINAWISFQVKCLNVFLEESKDKCKDDWRVM